MVLRKMTNKMETLKTLCSVNSNKNKRSSSLPDLTKSLSSLLRYTQEKKGRCEGIKVVLIQWNSKFRHANILELLMSISIRLHHRVYDST